MCSKKEGTSLYKLLILSTLLISFGCSYKTTCDDIVELQKEEISILRERLEIKDQRIDMLKSTLKIRDAQFSKLTVKRTDKDEAMWIETLPHYRPNQEGYYGVSEIGDIRNRVVQVIDPKSDGHFVVFDTEHSKKFQDVLNYAWYGRIRFRGDDY